MSAQSSRVFDDRLPSGAEIENANQLRQVIAGLVRDDEAARLQLLLDKGMKAEITLLPALSKTLLEVLRHIGSGRAVTIVPVNVQLSTQQAADLLNVSRPFFVKLLETGEIPHTKVGRHRRVKAADVFAYKRKRDSDRDEALTELADMDAANELL